MLAFAQIASGEDFELLCEEVLRTKGLRFHKRVSRGPDSGADIIAVHSSIDELGFTVKARILVECKHYARSGRSVRESQVGSFVERRTSFLE